MPIAEIVSGIVKGLGDTASSIIRDFRASPDKVLETDVRLKELDEKFKEAQIELTKSLEAEYTKQMEAEAKDLESSRNREIQIATSDKAPLINKIMTPLLGLVITLGFFGLLTYMLKYSVPAENKDILNVMLGSLGTAWIGVVGYYFHSSLGSKNKDDMLTEMIKKQ